MKRPLTIIVFSLVSILSFGQKIKFCDNSNVWHWFDHDMGLAAPIVSPSIDSFIGDTIIHAHAYKILYHKFGTPSKVVFVREDTAAQKVFAIATIKPDYDTSEQLLYDYSLNMGDTFRCKHSIHYVSGLDSVVISGSQYKVWYLHQLFSDSTIMASTDDYYVIDGIGCVSQPCFPLSPYSYETRSDLICFSNDGTTPALSNKVGIYFDNDASCSLTFGLGVNTKIYKNRAGNIYPNPANNFITITSAVKITNITISNFLGQTLLAKEYKDEEVQIEVSGLPAGVYFLKINGTEVRKFVKQ